MNELNELKAQAYDCILQIEAHQRQIEVYRQQLGAINDRIRDFKMPLPEVPIPPNEPKE